MPWHCWEAAREAHHLLCQVPHGSFTRGGFGDTCAFSHKPQIDLIALQDNDIVLCEGECGQTYHEQCLREDMMAIRVVHWSKNQVLTSLCHAG